MFTPEEKRTVQTTINLLQEMIVGSPREPVDLTDVEEMLHQCASIVREKHVQQEENNASV